MSFATDTAFLEKYADALDEMAAICAGIAQPNRATFMALSYFIQELLAQHEVMAGQLENRDANRAKRDRRGDN